MRKPIKWSHNWNYRLSYSGCSHLFLPPSPGATAWGFLLVSGATLVTRHHPVVRSNALMSSPEFLPVGKRIKNIPSTEESLWDYTASSAASDANPFSLRLTVTSFHSCLHARLFFLQLVTLVPACVTHERNHKVITQTNWKFFILIKKSHWCGKKNSAGSFKHLFLCRIQHTISSFRSPWPAWLWRPECLLLWELQT